MIKVDSLLYKIDQRLNKLSSNAHQRIQLEDKILALNESQIKEMGWPGGIQPITTKPHFIPNAQGNRNAEIADDGGTFKGPMTISLYCATQGASLAYTLDQSENPDWKLYNGPIRLESGILTIRAKAIRYGYKHSEEVSATFKAE